MPDLDEPSPFTTEGTLVRSFVKRQAPWHRASLASKYEPRTRTVATATIRFEGKRVVRTLRSVRPTRWLGNESLGHLRCRAAFVTAKFRQRAYEFVRAPRMPKLTHLVSRVRLIENRDHR